MEAVKNSCLNSLLELKIKFLFFYVSLRANFAPKPEANFKISNILTSLRGHIVEKNFKKMTLACVHVIFLMMSFNASRLHADEFSFNPYAIQSQYQDQDCCEINNCCEKGKFYFIGDFLYSKVTLDKISIGTAFTTTTAKTLAPLIEFGTDESDPDPLVSTALLVNKGKNINPDPAFSPGYRFRFVYETPSNWVFEAALGSVEGRAKNNVSADQIMLNAIDFPLFNAIKGNPLSGIHTNWSLYYFVAGFNIGRIIEPVKGLILIPYFGASYLSSSENYHYMGMLQSSTGIPPLAGTTVPTIAANADLRGNLKAKVIAGGLDAGIWSYWNICKDPLLGGDWFLWGRFGATARYTQLKQDGSLLIRQVNATKTLQGLQDLNIKSTSISGAYTFEGLVGLIYVYPIGDFVISARAAWEQHIQIFEGRNAPVQNFTFGGAVQF